MPIPLLMASKLATMISSIRSHRGRPSDLKSGAAPVISRSRPFPYLCTVLFKARAISAPEIDLHIRNLTYLERIVTFV